MWVKQGIIHARGSVYAIICLESIAKLHVIILLMLYSLREQFGIMLEIIC